VTQQRGRTLLADELLANGYREVGFLFFARPVRPDHEITQAEHDRQPEAEDFGRVWPDLAPHPDLDDSYFRD
jgi:hypothetical protein